VKKKTQTDLLNAGQQLANIAYNLAQRADRPLTESECRTLRECSNAWDAAAKALHAEAAAVKQHRKRMNLRYHMPTRRGRP
jgi:hypothetical protein